MVEESRPRPSPDPAGPRHSDLRDLIERLGAPAPPRGPSGRLLADRAEAPWSSVLDEIDSTVMARLLVFRNKDGAFMRIDARNRRILRAEFDTGGAGGNAALPHGPVALSYAGADRLATFRQSLRAFCNRGPVSVESQSPVGSPEPDETGISAAILRQVLARTETASIGRSGSRQAAGLADFAAASGARARSWVLSDARSVPLASSGDPDCPALTAALPCLGEMLDALPAGPGQALVLTPQEPGLGHLCLLSDGQARLVCLLAEDRLDALLSDWSRWQDRSRVS